jgi:hypothetical protein
MQQPKIHSGHIEVAVANYFGYRQNIIVPNISYGWDLRHEADLIIVNKNNYVSEVEIKISAADLRADFKKGHGHESKKIRSLYYALPDTLIELAKELVPQQHGILAIHWNEYTGRYVCQTVRKAKQNKNAAITDKELQELMRLAMMRIWTLKKHKIKK